MDGISHEGTRSPVRKLSLYFRPRPASLVTAATGRILGDRRISTESLLRTQTVPNFCTSRLPLAQVVCHAHKSSAGRTECPDARTTRRTRAQIAGTLAQTLRIVAQPHG
jgi:hypothetical protein